MIIYLYDAGFKIMNIYTLSYDMKCKLKHLFKTDHPLSIKRPVI